MSGPITGRANTYPRGQCTWWAAERYYETHAIFPPAWGNAASWLSGAEASGWTVSSSPINQSIICLQPGVQGANPVFGHVGFVESILSPTSVDTTDQNWGGITYPNFTHVTFKTGPGVSFLSAVGGGSTATSTPGSSTDACLACGPKGSTAYQSCTAQIAIGFVPDCAKAAYEASQAAAQNSIQTWFNSLINNPLSIVSLLSDPVRAIKALLGLVLILIALILAIVAFSKSPAGQATGDVIKTVGAAA